MEDPAHPSLSGTGVDVSVVCHDSTLYLALFATSLNVHLSLHAIAQPLKSSPTPSCAHTLLAGPRRKQGPLLIRPTWT